MDLVEFQKQMEHRDLIISLAQPRQQRIEPTLLQKPLLPQRVPDCMERVQKTRLHEIMNYIKVIMEKED